MMDPVHAALLARMGVGGPPGAGGPGPGGPGGTPNGGPNGHGMSSLQQIQSLIQDTHDAMRNIGDPQIVATLATCLKAFTTIQQQLMAPAGKGQ